MSRDVSVRVRPGAPYRKLAQLVERLPYTQNVIGSSPVLPTKFIRSVAQSGSAPGLGPGGPRFESLYSDQFNKKATMSKAEDQAVTDAALAEFLAKGGVIQQLKPNQSGRVEGESYSMWSKKKPSTSPLANPPENDE